MFNVSEELNELSEIFNKNKKTLYIVGGYVRNKIIGIADYENLDIDLCSSAKPLEVENLLKNTDFKTENIDNVFGVIIIIDKNGKKYEHATFRKEKYSVAGAHNPTNIQFIENLEEDAKRRDFCMNSIYYDIYRKELIDPLNGVDDIKNKIIRTTREPRLVFNDDSERILRLIRQACCLGFNITDEVLMSAKNNVFKLKFLSKQKLKIEFEKLLLLDNFYKSIKVKNANIRSIELLLKLGACEYILPMLQEIYNKKIIDDKNDYLINHILNVLKLCKEKSIEIRYSILMHDYGKSKALIDNNNFDNYINYNNEIIENELTLLNYNKSFINKVKTIVNSSVFNINIFTRRWKVRKFIINNIENIENIILLKKYILLVKNNKVNIDFNKILKEYYNVNKNYIKTKREIVVNYNDIIEKYPNINLKHINIILDKLFEVCIKNYKNNNKKYLYNKLNKLIKKNKGEFLC